jgi:hypothetical protein
VVPVDEYGRPTTKIIEPYLRDEDGAAFNTPKKNYAKAVKTSPDQADEYVQAIETPSYKTLPDLNMLLTRIYSTDPSHVAAYKSWAYYSTPDIDDIPEAVRAEWAQNGGAWLYEVAPYMKHQTEITTAVDADGNAVDQVTGWKPGFDVNLRYFVNYQLNHMYWRYFMWNFAGRQNDISGNGEPHLGNWISGIPAIDNAPRRVRQGQQGPQRVLHVAAVARRNRFALASPLSPPLRLTSRHRAILGGVLPILHDRYRHRALPQPDTRTAA